MEIRQRGYIGSYTGLLRLLAESRPVLVITDDAGKSIPAALLMATIQASLRSLAASPLCLE